MMGAAGTGDAALVHALLDARADPELASDAGVQAAELAAQHGHGALAASLQAAGTRG